MKSNREANKEIKEMFEQPVEEAIQTAPVTPIAKPARSKKYIVTVNNLAIRRGPGREYEKVGIAEPGINHISEISNGYGKLADGTGWVSMDYVRKAD